jgi:hypothetical protein
LSTLLVKAWFVHVNAELRQCLVSSLALFKVAQNFPQCSNDQYCFVAPLPELDDNFPEFFIVIYLRELFKHTVVVLEATHLNEQCH